MGIVIGVCWSTINNSVWTKKKTCSILHGVMIWLDCHNILRWFEHTFGEHPKYLHLKWESFHRPKTSGTRYCMLCVFFCRNWFVRKYGTSSSRSSGSSLFINLLFRVAGGILPFQTHTHTKIFLCGQDQIAHKSTRPSQYPWFASKN